MSQSEADNNPPETTEDTEHAKNIREAWEWLRAFRDQRTAAQKIDDLTRGIQRLKEIFTDPAWKMPLEIFRPPWLAHRFDCLQHITFPQLTHQVEEEFWVLGNDLEISSGHVNLDPPTSCQSLGFHRALHVSRRVPMAHRLPSAGDSDLSDIKFIVAANHGQQQINPHNHKWASPWQFVLEKQGGLRTGFEVVFRPPDSTVSSGGIRHLLMTLTIRNWYAGFWKDEKYTERVLEVQREKAKIPGRESDLLVEETRVFLCLQLVSFGDVMAYSLTSLSDKRKESYEGSWGGQDGQRLAGLYGQAVGVYEFLRRTRSSLGSCQFGWEQCLNDIDLLNGVKMGDSLNQEKWNSFMFDESFRLSKTCFSIVQLMQIADGWVQETQKDINRLIVQLRGILHVFEHSIRQRLESDLDGLEKEVKEGMDNIRNRISLKSEQSKALQDVLFNTTSIREATRGMALNRAIYVFTAVTVIYTPLAFVVALWALPFLNHEKEDGSTSVPSGVIVTSIVIPLVTYVLASLFAVYFASNRVRNWVSASWYWILKAQYKLLLLITKLVGRTFLARLSVKLLVIIWNNLPKEVQKELGYVDSDDQCYIMVG